MVKKRSNIAISISQIIILIASIVAFSYFVGQEFKVVSATDICLEGKDGGLLKITDQFLQTQSQINTWCKTANNKNYCSSTDSGAGNEWRLDQVACSSPAPKIDPDPEGILAAARLLSSLPNPTNKPSSPTPTTGYTAADLAKAIKEAAAAAEAEGIKLTEAEAMEKALEKLEKELVEKGLI